MRLWSIHPKYLDPTGLTACWREGLLARKVLAGATVGYRNHPQLIRFRESEEPLRAIDCYLEGILEESLRRGYRFDPTKIDRNVLFLSLCVSSGQLAYEFEHLRRKLRFRAPEYNARLTDVCLIEPHPMFWVVPGGVAVWEISV